MTTLDLHQLRDAFPFLQLVSPELQQLLVRSTRPVSYAFGEIILEQGQPIDDVVLVRSGRVRVLGTDAMGEEIVLGELGPGGIVGSTVLRGRTAPSTYRCIGPVDGLAVDDDVITAIAATDEEARRYLDAQGAELDQAASVRAHPVIGALPEAVLIEIVARARRIEVPEDTMLCTQGAPGGPVWLVEEGRLIAFVGSGDARRETGFHRPGDVLGAEAHVADGRHLESIETVDACRLTELPADLVAELLAAAPEVGAALRDAATLPDDTVDRVPLDFADAVTRVEPGPGVASPGAAVPAADASTPAPSHPDEDVPVDLADPPGGRPTGRRFPVVRQVDEMDCGAACLAMVIRSFGQPVALSTVRGAVGTRTEGTSMLGIAHGARTLGLESRPLKVSKDRAASLPFPAVIHWEGNHWVVLHGASRDGETFRIADPGRGLRRVSREELVEKWTGFAVLFGWTPAARDIPQPKSPLQTVWPLFRSQSRALWIGLALALVAAALQLAVPIMTQRIFDTVLPEADYDLLNLMVLALAGVTLLITVASLVQRWVLARAAVRIDGDTLHFLSGRLLALPMSYFATRRTGDIQRRLEGMRQVRQLVVRSGVESMTSIALLVAALALMLSYSVTLTLVYLAVAPLYVGLLRMSAKRLRPEFDSLEEAFGRYQSQQIDAIKGIETVKAIGAEETLRQRLVQQFESLSGRLLRSEFLVMAYEAVVGIAIFVGIGLFLWVGARQVLDGDLTVGEFVSFNSLVLLANGPVLTLLATWDQFQTGSVLVGRLDDILEAEPEQGADHSHLRPVPTLSGRVSLHSVGFWYPGPVQRPILRDIDLDVEPGSTIAIVGRSGSGKTTLIKVMTGMLEPTEGEVRYDGVELRELDHRALRRHMGFVLQENYLFDDTISRNIALGRDADPARVVEAARLANAHDFIESLPLGYETKVGESGLGLSGGQRQRIAIARALYSDPAVLVFDEATSALDTESEQAVQQNLATLLEERTSFVIAHRLSTIRNADLIIVLEQGQIVERGTHDELIARGGLYHHLASQQLSL